MTTNTPAPADLVEAVAKAIEIDFAKRTAYHPVRKWTVRLMTWLPKRLAEAAIAAYQARMASDGASDEKFCDAVWEALKGDHNDLRKQQMILAAHRRAAAGGKVVLDERQSATLHKALIASFDEVVRPIATPQPDPLDAQIAELREALEKADAWIENDETSGMGPSELAARDRLLNKIATALAKTGGA